MRFGLFVHWGVYTQPAGIWNGQRIEKLGEQIQRHANIPDKEYRALASQFNPVNFDADDIVRLAKASGMRYIVLTAKHHDGFAMFATEHSDFNIVDFTEYKQDILKQLAEACRKYDMKLGVYYSTPDWHFNGPNPERNPDDGKLSVFGKVSKANEDFQVAQLKELMTHYGDITEVFFDMGEPTLAQSQRFRKTVKDLQPNTLINGRIMNDQGDFLTMPDNHVPDTPITEFPWETPGTFYHTWGYKSWVVGAPLHQQVKQQIRKLSSISSMGGNFLLNIGPKADGSIVPYERQVLEGIGQWLRVNSQAIFAKGLNPFPRLPWGLASSQDQKLYLHVYDWPTDGLLKVPGFNNLVTAAYALAQPVVKLAVTRHGDGQLVDLSGVKEDPNLTIVVLEFEGNLKPNPNYIQADTHGVVNIPGGLATRHGKYGKQSYRSMLKDFYRSWFVDIPADAEFQVEVTYQMGEDEKEFVLELGAKPLAFTLQGSGSAEPNINSFDGNETNDLKVKTNDRYRTVILKEPLLGQQGKQRLFLKPGQPFELKATTTEFRNQDQRYRTLNIDIKTIRLLPLRH